MRNRFVVSLILALLPTANAAAQSFAILYHETFETSDAVSNAKPLEAAPARAHATSLSFRAFGKQFEVTLEPNERIEASGGTSIGVQLYRGELAGRQGTWARMNRLGADWTGVIFDGTELYFIERREALRELLAGAQANGGDTIVYRWSDTSGELVDQVVARAAPSSSSSSGGNLRPDARALLDALFVEAPLSPARQLEVEFVGDFEFWQLTNGHAANRLLEIANVVDGVFGPQVGLYFSPQLTTFSSSADPFTATTPAALLSELQDYKVSTPALRSLDLVHLFTGRHFASNGADQPRVVGAAVLGGVCDERFGAGLTDATFGITSAALVTAHEIAHNLGAPHDGEAGSPCSASSSGFLMEPRANGSSILSQCSLDEIDRTLATRTCMSNIAPIDLSLTLAQLALAPVVGSVFSVELVVTSPPSGAAAHDVALNLTLEGLRLSNIYAPSDWSCDRASLPVVCSIDTLRPGRVDRMTLYLYSEVTMASLRAGLSSLNDPATGNDSAEHTFSIAPAADLRVAVTPDQMEARPGDERTFTVNVSNRRFYDAVGSHVSVSAGYSVEILGAAAASGSCAAMPPPNDGYDCDLQTIPVGESREVVVRARMRGQPSINQSWSSTSLTARAYMTNTAELSALDNSASAGVVVSERFVDIAASISGPREVLLGDSARYAATFRNNGPDRATNVRMALTSSPSWDVTGSIESVVGAGTCAHELTEIVCHLPTMEPGQTLAVTANFRPAAAGTYRFATYASQYERDRVFRNDVAEEVAWVHAAVTPPPPPSPPAAPSVPEPPPAPAPSASSGGGAIGLYGLLALVAAALNRRRHAAVPRLRRSRETLAAPERP